MHISWEQDSLCCDIMLNWRQNIYCDRTLVCRDTNFYNMEKFVEIEKMLKKKFRVL